MTRGLKAYDEKQRRKMRRRNHIARDLAKAEFRQRIKPGKPKELPPEIDEWEDDLNDDN